MARFLDVIVFAFLTLMGLTWCALWALAGVGLYSLLN